MGDRLFVMTENGVDEFKAVPPPTPDRFIREFDSANVLATTGRLLAKLRETG